MKELGHCFCNFKRNENIIERGINIEDYAHDKSTVMFQSTYGKCPSTKHSPHWHIKLKGLSPWNII